MANAERGEVDLDVGGKTFTLRLGSNALASIEETLGIDLTEIIEQFQSGRVKLSLLRGVLFGALREHHKDVSLFDAGDILDKVGVATATTAIGEAFNRAFPVVEGEAENPPHPAGTGKPSSKGGSRSPASPRKPSGNSRRGR